MITELMRLFAVITGPTVNFYRPAQHQLPENCNIQNVHDLFCTTNMSRPFPINICLHFMVE